MYSIFQKIYETGKESDFLKMYDSENPSIRVYVFWAFVKNKKYGEAKKIMHLEKNKEAYVYWNSAGCELKQVLTADLMKDLLKRMKKYGS
ncbi:hypothetical protein [Xanthomarina gelatinilytica]|nr:hypothetical protein [Xanthomarina gelatinilytica]